MNREVPQVKAVSETKTIEELGNLPKIFEVVVNRDGQLWCKHASHLQIDGTTGRTSFDHALFFALTRKGALP
jgi:hypothetical protein